MYAPLLSSLNELFSTEQIELLQAKVVEVAHLLNADCVLLTLFGPETQDGQFAEEGELSRVEHYFPSETLRAHFTTDDIPDIFYEPVETTKRVFGRRPCPEGYVPSNGRKPDQHVKFHKAVREKLFLPIAVRDRDGRFRVLILCGILFDKELPGTDDVTYRFSHACAIRSWGLLQAAFCQEERTPLHGAFVGCYDAIGASPVADSLDAAWAAFEESLRANFAVTSVARTHQVSPTEDMCFERSVSFHADAGYRHNVADEVQTDGAFVIAYETIGQRIEVRWPDNETIVTNTPALELGILMTVSIEAWVAANRLLLRNSELSPDTFLLPG